MTEPPEGVAGLTGRRDADEQLLNDADALTKADPGMMLRAVASAGPQVRESVQMAAEANLSELAEEGRPRSVVVAGAGTAARTGDILATVAGSRSLVPVISHRSPGVPGWVGAADVVVAVSASGRSPE
ncbi:MAG: SIS domain-containing protein, partial [Micromonosporaceae bacterium]